MPSTITDTDELVARLQQEVRVYRQLLLEEQDKTRQLSVDLAMARQQGTFGAQAATRPQHEPSTATGPGGEVLSGIANMTPKQRAVFFATLCGISYRDIAIAMGVDDTTVKLHFKAALAKVGAPSREAVVAASTEIVHAINAAGGEKVFGMPVNWIETKPEAVMQLLERKRSTVPPPGGGRHIGKPRSRR